MPVVAHDMSFIPKRPAGGSDPEETRAMQAFWDHKYDPKHSIFIDEVGAPVRIIKQTDGRYRIHTNIRPGGGTAAAATNFRGEWLSAAIYSRGEEVVISLGANRGFYKYVAYAASAGHEPWVGGGYWFKVSDSLGLWM